MGQHRAALIGPSCAAPIGWGKLQSLEMGLQELLSKGRSDGRNIGRAERQFSAEAGILMQRLLPKAQLLWEVPVQKWLLDPPSFLFLFFKFEST